MKKVCVLMVITIMILPLISCNQQKSYKNGTRTQFENATINVGDTINFGTYEQDNDASNGKENIEWSVISKKGDKILIISKYALDSQKYDDSDNGIPANHIPATWEKCSLRKWLNKTFLNDAFSEDEQKTIVMTKVNADKNPNYDSADPGNATKDKIFILSVKEAEEYYITDESRMCAPTAYAMELAFSPDLFTSDNYKTESGESTCMWWLRSPGPNQFYATGVGYDGSIDYCTMANLSVHIVDMAIRPALWLNLANISCNQLKSSKKENIESTASNANIEVGGKYIFGKYEQDNNITNGKEEIEWIILEKNDTYLLLCSKFALDCQQYYTSDTGISWEKCNLRTWLNTTFLNNAFDNDEQAMIATNVSANNDSNNSNDVNNTISDKVFLLSATEAEKYFSTYASRKCVPTAFAKVQGAYTYSDKSNKCYWWLRFNDISQIDQECVNDCGFVSRTFGIDSVAVRPALWIKLEQ